VHAPGAPFHADSIIIGMRVVIRFATLHRSPQNLPRELTRIQPAVLRGTYFAVLSVLPALVACSGSHRLSHEDLQTEFRASISLASETELFLGHLDTHRYSPHFIQGHLSYLQKQGSEIQSDLAHASAQTPDAASLQSLRKTGAELTQVLDTLCAQPPNASPDASSISHLHSIGKRLEADIPR
jgi:hypothetical protein